MLAAQVTEVGGRGCGGGGGVCPGKAPEDPVQLQAESL